ncbi:MAG: ATP-dependent protease La, partial [Actinobacteria bacterium]|nr:ATP-dependent protease La [Actinomycetota bacterium]
LSDVLFIATANVMDTIPGPLLDRMELITIDGYTEDDKVAIARDFLVPRQLERNALTAEEVTVTDAALREIAANYTREAGVRQMERLIAKALRKAATRLSEDVIGSAAGESDAVVSDLGYGAELGYDTLVRSEKSSAAVSSESAGAVPEESLTIDVADLKKYLGRPRFTPDSVERTAVPGVATGLAVTGLGGDVLYIEANVAEGERSLTLTGQLGDVMKESAQIALSYVRSHAAELGIDPKAFENRTFHLHVPAGAVPKDGPSAGVTMTTALVSLLTGRPVRSVVGMTGEVTLQGRVLPIGGLKQKVLAAHRAGLKEVVFPARNEVDLDELPESVKEQMTFHSASEVAQVLAVALEAPKVAEHTPAQAA